MVEVIVTQLTLARSMAIIESVWTIDLLRSSIKRGSLTIKSAIISSSIWRTTMMSIDKMERKQAKE